MEPHLGLDDISWDVFAACGVECAFAAQQYKHFICIKMLLQVIEVFRQQIFTGP